MTDIVVGGAGDRLFGCARRWADGWAARQPERTVLYFAQGRRRALLRAVLRAVREAERPNLIGHSWGAADVSWAVARTDAPLGLVVGVDPVGKPGLWRGVDVGNAHGVLSIYGTGSEGRLADGNLSARLGRAVGHHCPPAFDTAPCVHAPFAHYDMARMMRFAPLAGNEPDGRSAEDRLLHP